MRSLEGKWLKETTQRTKQTVRKSIKAGLARHDSMSLSQSGILKNDTIPRCDNEYYSFNDSEFLFIFDVICFLVCELTQALLCN